MNWKRFIILFVSVVSIAGGVKLVLACADGPDPLEAPSFFLNTINKEPAFVPFYYSPEITFYSEWMGFGRLGVDDKIPDPNIPAWRKFTGGVVTDVDIDSFVYKFAAKNVMNIYNHIQKNYSLEVPSKVAQNGFTKWLIKNRDAETALYLAFAKECEPHSRPRDDMWNDTTEKYVLPKRDSASMQELVHEGIKRCNAAINPEIKLRYAYQSIRMAFYSGENPQTIMLFNTLITSREDHFVYYRCLGLKAGALYRTDKPDAAAYLYSLAFDKSDELKKSTYISFDWAANGKIHNVLNLCKNDHERAVLYIMLGLGGREDKTPAMFAALKNAYRYDPKARGLDIVMTRCINEIEHTMAPDIAYKNTRNDTLLNALNAFARKVAREGKTGDNAYWLLSSAYLYLLNGELDKCAKLLGNAKAAKMIPTEQDVYLLLNTIYTVRKNGRITSKAEQDILPSLRTLQQRVPKEKRYSSVFSNVMLTVLKESYLLQHDTVRALYCYSKSYSVTGRDFYFESGNNDFTNEGGNILEKMSPQKLHDMQEFVQKKNKTTFELWLTDNTPYTPDVLYELEGTKYIRMLQFDKAVETLRKVNDSTLRKTKLPDALISHILDSQEWNSSDSLTKYNKLTFATKMMELQQQLETYPKDSRAAYQYANGLYSMSFYGKAHHAYDYYRHPCDDKSYFNCKERNPLKQFELEYYNVSLPEQYYMQAFENTADRELKARCLFMAGKCRQKNCPVKNDHKYWEDKGVYYKNSIESPYFKRLKNEYRNTEFYTKAVGTCSYFRDYVSINR